MSKFTRPTGERRLFAAAIIAACGLLPFQGCDRMGCDRTGSGTAGAPECHFDGAKIVLSESGAPLTGPIFDERWAAVVDADSRQTAWLNVPVAEEPRLKEVQPGRRWVAEGFVRGPGLEASEVLRDNKLFRYKCEIEAEDGRSFSVTYSAEVLQHVVLASFSNFVIRLPLAEYTGARAVVDDSFGGVISRDGPPIPSHPSYWEGPLRSLKINAEPFTLEVAAGRGGFNWVSFLDGRALESPEPSLIIQLYPSLAGPHTRLGSLAAKGTSYSANFKFTVGPPLSVPTTPSIEKALKTEKVPAPLPPDVIAALGAGGWELEPFLQSGAEPLESPVSFGQIAKWCDVVIDRSFERCGLDVGGDGPPRLAFIAVRGPVEDLRLKINGRGDCLDGREIVEELYPKPEDDRRLAEAVWRYAADATYSMPLHPTDDLGEFMGSYGYGFSSTLSAMALVRLWGHAGLPARRVYLSGSRGYAIAEAYYGDEWHAYDLADRAFYADPADLSVASAQELVSRPGLVSLNCDAKGMGPGGTPASETAGEKYKDAGISYNLGGIEFERLMKTSLGVGELFLRLLRPEGRWAPSPREPYNYANALLAFAPDFGEPDALEGFSSVQNFTLKNAALVPQNGAAPASIEYRAVSPYVIVESKVKIGADDEVLQRLSLLLSTDAGETWQPVDFDVSAGTADLTPYLVPGPQAPGTAYETLARNFGFELHIELSARPEDGSGGIESLSVLTWTQANPALLPTLTAGSNEVEIECASCRPGASATLGWVEGDVRVEPTPAYTGEGFSIVGAVANGREVALGDLEVRAYAENRRERVEIGAWRADGAVPPGTNAPFEIRCRPIDSDLYDSGGPIDALDVALEIVKSGNPGAAPPWDTRYSMNVPLRHRPDLVLLPALVLVSPPRPRPGEEVEIVAIVRNFCPTRDLLYMAGTTSPAADVALYELRGDTRVPLQRVTTPEIPPGSAVRAVFKWTAPASSGPASLLLVADPDDRIQERDEANTAAFQIMVAPAHP